MEQAVSLYDQVWKLKQEASDLTVNPLIMAFDLEQCREIDEAFGEDEFVRSRRTGTLDLLNGCSADYTEHLRGAYDRYSEATAYLELRAKGLNPSHPPEGDGGGPDFQVVCDGTVHFIEHKVLHFAGGETNYTDTTTRGLNSQVYLEDQVKKGKRPAFAETVISPYCRGPGYDPGSPRFISEQLVEKIEQNFKPKQFNSGETSFLLDLSLLGLLARPTEAALVAHVGTQHGSLASGELWHAAFGTHGNLMLRPIEFEGASNIDGPFRSEGILRAHTDIASLLFRTRFLDRCGPTIALVRHKDFNRLGQLLSTIADFWNDDKNSNAWQVLRDPNGRPEPPVE